MAVGLYKYDGNISDRGSKLILSENIASQQFYEKYWEKAIKELNIKSLSICKMVQSLIKQKERMS